ncbi:MAG TPA: SDR family NAD(P)-dependent oxidoreductase [Planctomycetaceae bacterium]|jgi:NAD(P)-dependent dehydrogenase (short-subunit alcohol dehydrogenase family)|nr:SDR family NAD(P)-dependent oxidoreductase [Planctomycetaceae bacterium]
MQKTILITGANRGIGLQTAKELAGRGFRVYLGTRDERAGVTAVASVGNNAEVLVIDVADSKSIAAAARALADKTDRLDVLINNAGVYPDHGISILEVARDRMIETFQTNTFGPIEVTQACLPLLRKAEAARVINVSSGYGQLDGLSPGVPSYCLSKLTLNGVTIMLAQALRSDRIAVNSVCPGWVRTDMGGANADRSVEEGADTVVWLASEAPATLTGKFFRDRAEIPW